MVDDNFIKNINYVIDALNESSMKNYDEIKSKDTFIRAWEIITFSRYDRKSLAEILQDQSKAIAVLLQILYEYMQNNDAKVNKYILESSSKIAALLKKEDLDFYTQLNISKKRNLSKIKDKGKEILFGIVNEYSENYSINSPETETYIDTLCKFYHKGISKISFDNIDIVIQSIAAEEKEIIAMILLELYYTDYHTFDNLSDIACLIEYTDVGGSTLKRFEEQIKNDCNNGGIANLLYKYEKADENEIRKFNDFMTNAIIEKEKDYEGIYVIRSAENRKCLWDIGSSYLCFGNHVCLHEKGDSVKPSQLWKIEKVNNTYRIINYHSNNVLVPTSHHGGRIWGMYAVIEENVEENMKWNIVPNDDGSVSFKSTAYGTMSLSVMQKHVRPNTMLHCNLSNNSIRQRWILEKVESEDIFYG